MAILAYKSGNLISVKPTFKANTWKENGTKDHLMYVNPKDPTRKVFEGTNAVNDALDWIGTPEALALKVNVDEQQTT